jgi:xanthine dehydrogenase YagR molybdenum-binding subunit
VVKSGVGCAGAAWPAGGASRQTQGEAQINPDGSIEFRLGVQDIGTGTKTVIAVVAAELLGLKPEQITVKVGDTHFPPGPGSGGSTTCASVSPTVYDVCTKALQQMQTQSGLADVRGKNWFAAKSSASTRLSSMANGSRDSRLTTRAACSSRKSPWILRPAWSR